MSSITVIKRDITTMRTDCIVNAANSGLQAGGGVCGAIFAAAGYDAMQQACDAIGRCPTGEAVLTPGFDLFAKYVIHAVGPIWQGGRAGEAEALYSCYGKALELAADHDCTSITFPLISSGIYGYPKEEAWDIAIRSCADFIDLFEGYDIDIYFAVMDDITKAMGEKTIERVLGAGEDDEEESGNLIEASFAKEGGPYAAGSPEVERAIREWYESENEEDLDAALDVLFRESAEGLEVIVPVQHDEDGEEMYQMISGEDDDYWMACFTNNTEKVKGEQSSSVVLPMKEVMDKALHIDGCSGIAINPWGEGMFLPREIIESMMSEMTPKTQDQIDLEKGLDAYAVCNYDRAAELFAKAAGEGNTGAAARLGLCLFYGRGTDENQEEAVELWRRMAIFGDVTATYLLGDIYHSAGTENEIDFARQLYHKAFADACTSPTIWTFPDAGLRVLKHCRDDQDAESLEAMASDIVDCYGERIRLGDKTCALEYAEAERILEEIRTGK